MSLHLMAKLWAFSRVEWLPSNNPDGLDQLSCSSGREEKRVRNCSV